jgi:signal transduction histidine kinase
MPIAGDPTRMEQVLSNLLNNAAKYTDEGGQIRVEASTEGREVVFRVRDTGIGIAAEMLPKVFDMFTQADSARDRSHGGLGIGLRLVRDLTELHGGRVARPATAPAGGASSPSGSPSWPSRPSERL